MDEPVTGRTAGVPRAYQFVGVVGTASTTLASQGPMALRFAIGVQNGMRHALDAERW